MAEEKKVLVDIEINSEDIKKARDAMSSSAKEAALLTLELNKLKEEQKKNNAEAKAGAISATELASRQAGLKLQMTETSKALAASNKDYVNNKIVVDAAKGSNDQLKARLSLLTKEYNAMSEEQKVNTESGKQLGATVDTLTTKLKGNEKAVGDNRRNVGNYEDALGKATGKIGEFGDMAGKMPGTLGKFGQGLSGVASGFGKATIAAMKFLLTPIGAVIGGIALAVGSIVGVFKLFSESLNRTEDGAAALSGVMNVFKGIMSGVLKTVEPIALFLVEGLADGFEKLGEVVETVSKGIEKALRFIGMEAAANGLNTITTNIEETSSATAKLSKAEAELNKIKREQGKIQLEFQNRAEKQRQIRDDESKSIKERMQANRDLGVVLTEQSSVETALAQRSLEIANLRIKAEGDSSENLDRKAEAELKLLEIEERINSQRSEQMTNENSLIRDGVALAKEANATRIAILKEKEEATKEEEEATKEAAAALIKSFEDQRSLIDEAAELEKNQAIISIESAEERAEKIAFIDRETLQKKIDSLNNEMVEETAAAGMVSAIDEEKYAKQLALRAKFEAELAEMARESSDREFNDAVRLSSDKLKLAELQADNEIQNTEELERKKKELRLAALQEQLALTKQFFGELSEEEQIQLDTLAAMIEKLKIDAATPPEDGGTLASGLGIDEEGLEKAEAAFQILSDGLNAVSQIVNAQATVQLNNLDARTQAEIDAVETSTATEEVKAAKIKAIERKAATEEWKIKKKQFEANQKISITQAIIAGALGVVNAFQLGPIAGAIAAILIAATTVSQVAAIASAKPPAAPKFARGGYVSGAGTETSDSIDAKLSTGESVNNARTTKMFGREISAMNALGGGVDWFKNTNASGNRFAQGGIVSPTFAARQTTQVAGLSRNDLAEVIAQMPAPIVTVSDINRVQGQVATVSQSADL